MKPYQHLLKEERFYIWKALRDGKTQKQVATALGRHPATICREIKRNKYGRCHIYTYYWAMQIVSIENNESIEQNIVNSMNI